MRAEGDNKAMRVKISPGTQNDEAGRALGVPGQPRLQRKTLHQNRRRIKMSLKTIYKMILSM